MVEKYTVLSRFENTYLFLKFIIITNKIMPKVVFIVVYNFLFFRGRTWKYFIYIYFFLIEIVSGFVSAQCSFLFRIWILIIRIPVTLILKSLLHGTFPWNVEYFKYYNPQQCTVHLYSKQDCQIQEITGSRNKYCPARSENHR